jgi:transposase
MKKTETKVSPTRERRHYDEVFKRHAVDLTLQPGRRVTEVAGELGVPESMLYAWRRQFAPRPPPRTFEEIEAENVQLRAEIVQMQERELVLKKSLGILSEAPERGMPKSKR